MQMALDQDKKVQENRVRRLAHRRGFDLSKSRRRDEYAVDFGEWSLTRGTIKGEGGSFPMQTRTFPTLEDVEAFVTDVPRIEIELRNEGQIYVESKGKNRDKLQSLVREAVRLRMPIDAVAHVASPVPLADIAELAGGDA